MTVTEATLRLQRRREAVELLADKFGVEAPALEAVLAGDIGLGRFALIEESAPHGHSTWLTLHPTRKAALDHHDGQEDACEWRIVQLVDFDNGKAYRADVTVRWREVTT